MVPRAGRYSLAGWFTQAPDYGPFDVGAAGRRIGGFDGYHNGGVVRSDRVVLGEVDVPVEELALVLVVTGKDRAVSRHGQACPGAPGQPGGAARRGRGAPAQDQAPVAEASAWPKGQVDIFKAKPYQAGSPGNASIRQRPCDPYAAK
ncbi:MAG: hypothetical protein BIFFINMI_00885 [Phycisphaerae bacterium]|nr:hypothetical protein [Phycisphaerae bacterium]